MKGRTIHYSDEELAWIKARKEWPRQKLHSEFCVRFGRTDVAFHNLKSLCGRNGWLTGRTGQYVPGQVSVNKGKTMPYNANSAKTWFKKGRAPHNTKFLGHERISKDGYVEVSVQETNPHTGFGRRYVLKHRHLWEQVNGPIPSCMCLKCLGSDRTNTDPTNWEMIPRAMLPRLNGRHSLSYDDAADEVKPTVMAIAKLEHLTRVVSLDKNGLRKKVGS